MPKSLLRPLFRGVRQKGMACLVFIVCHLFLFLTYSCAAPAPGAWVCEVQITSSGPHELVLFYTSDKGQDFDPSRNVGASRVGRSARQTYQMVLPDNISLVDMRLDLGSDHTLEMVQIHKIAITNENGVIEISAEEIPRFFSLNTFAKFGTEPGCIKVSPKDGRFDPFLRAKPILKHRLKMTKKGIWH